MYSNLSISGSVSLTDNFTICLWHKYVGTSWTQGVLFAFLNGIYYLYLACFNSQYLSLRYYDANGMGTIDYTTTTTANISANTWHHYTFVCDRMNTVFKLYVDGVLISSDSWVNGFNCNDLNLNTLGDSSHS